MSSVLEDALSRLTIDRFETAAWDIKTSVMGADGWQAAKLVVSGTLKPGIRSQGDIIASHTTGAVAHDGDGGIDYFHLHGLSVDGASGADTPPRGSTPQDDSPVGSFLGAYGSADAHGMIRACRPDARYQGPWPGPGFRGRRRTTGYVATDGKPMWRALFDAFADFHLTVERLINGPGDASAAAEVVMRGRQVGPWLRIHNFGATFSTTGVIFFEIGEDGLITSVDEVLDLDLLESQLLTMAGV